jgi:hypothetical protein
MEGSYLMLSFQNFFFLGNASISVSCDNSLNTGDLLSSAPKICSLSCTELDSCNFGFYSAFQKYFRRIVWNQLLFLTSDRPTNEIISHLPPPHPYPSGPGSPHYRGFTITLRHTILGRTVWGNDQSDAETST